MPKSDVEWATRMLFNKLAEAIDDCIDRQSTEGALQAATTWLRSWHRHETASAKYHTYRFVDQYGGRIELLYRVKNIDRSKDQEDSTIHEFDLTLTQDDNTVEYRSWRHF